MLVACALRELLRACLRRKNHGLAVTAILLVIIIVVLTSQILTTKRLHRHGRLALEGQPALTLATTFSDNPQRFQVHSQTVYNWAALRPQLRPVLFAGNLSSSLALLAKRHGWEVQFIQDADQQGMPYINSLFKLIQEQYDSHFYGYSNGDMLFGSSLTETLYSVQRETHVKHEHFLFIAQRTSVNYKDMLKMDSQFWRPDRVQEYACTMGRPDPPTTIDFFITTPYGIPWDTLPQLVIGKTCFDNYIIMIALYLFVGTVDVTGTVHNMHMTGGGKSMTHSDNHLLDQGANQRIINQFGHVSFELGSVANCKYLTRKTERGIELGKFLDWKIPPGFQRLQVNAKEMMVSTV
ncbi:hypothetical protein CAPTEDRAFT_217659 [Capitella teleta]|uniref:Uncharacterized protein n=1 Tax=Capitella teleta TaxID=283909 RepID=X2AMI1_CAPTE|nr:hypothetical protein CAPTEDRAFT_217659 [Capitella teleta]|eukprot:ELU00276.1 hypothetical protein CAPTEDRAFT_217659 [Capitella teleta]